MTVSNIGVSRSRLGLEGVSRKPSAMSSVTARTVDSIGPYTPLETFPDGSVKSRLTAARAQMFPDTGYIWGEKIRVEQYKNPGTTNVWANLVAENCIVDRKTKSGWVEGDAMMVYGDSSVKGRGIYFSLPREFIKILSKCEIRTKGAKMAPRSLLK